jgi:hypothetical protein
MKTNLLVATALLSSAISVAQSPYKKANILTKTGRTYEVGLSVNSLGEDTKKTAAGVFFNIGTDKSTSRYMGRISLEYILKTNATNSIFSFNLNPGLKILSPKEESRKVDPYVGAVVGISFGKVIAGVNYGLNGGTIINLNEKLSINLGVIYAKYGFAYTSRAAPGFSGESFNLPNIGFTVGLRFKMAGE